MQTSTQSNKTKDELYSKAQTQTQTLEPGKTTRRQKGGTMHNSTKAARKTGIFIQTHPIRKPKVQNTTKNQDHCGI